MSRSLYDSIVSVESSDPTNLYFGTSFPIHWDGQATYFSTCAHVIKDIGGPDKIVVRLKERERDPIPSSKFQAELIASGEPFGIDLVVLRVEGLSGLSIWPLRSNSPEPNTPFLMAGYSSPDNKHFQFDELQGSFGIKTQLGGRQTEKSRIYIDAWKLIFPKNTHTHLQKGHSGSPIIDESHYAIAVSRSMQEEGSEGTAISIEALKIFWSGRPPGLFIPSQIPECRVGKILARGPESVVCEGWYRKSQEQTEEQVAVKFLPLDPPTEGFPQYFVRNVKTCQDALASHKNIVALKACDELPQEHYAYLIMEYAPDKSLGDQMNSGQLIPFDRRLTYILEVAEALNYAHLKYITHGNLKLSNFLLRNGRILLSDFEMLTRHATALIDLSSAIPILRQGKVQREKEWKDQYDLAEIAYQLLTEVPSLEDGQRILSSTHPSLARVLDRALAPDGLDRHSSMVHFHWMLKQARPSSGQTQHPGSFVPSTPSQGSQNAGQVEQTQHPGSFVPPLTQNPGGFPKPTSSSPLVSFYKKRKNLLIAMLAIMIVTGAILGANFWSHLSVTHYQQSYCLATEFPTSGTESTQGAPPRNGADLAIKEHPDLGSGYTLNACSDKDDVSPITRIHDPKMGEQNLQLLIDDKTVLGLVGPWNSNVAQAEIPRAAQAGFPIVSPDPSVLCLTQKSYCTYPGQENVHPSGTSDPFFFRICSNDQQQGQAANHLFKSLNLHKVFVVDDSEVYGQELADMFIQALNNDEMVGHDQISKDEPPTQLAKLVQNIISSHAEAVFYGGVTSNGAGQLKAQLVQAGFAGPLIGGGGIADDQQFLSDAGSNANNTYAIALGPDASTLPSSFVQMYQGSYGLEPTQDSARGYDAAMILINAIKDLIKTNPQIMHSDVGSIRKAVREKVRHPEQQYHGVTGQPITFTSDGDNAAAKIFVVYAVVKGLWVYQPGLTITLD